jgi:hypothetical protein
MSTRLCFIVLIAVVLLASVPTLQQPAPPRGGPLLLIDRDTIVSHSRSTRSEIAAAQTTRATPSRAAEDNGPAAQLAEIVASAQGLLVRTKRLLLETSVLWLRLLARLSRFETL